MAVIKSNSPSISAHQVGIYYDAVGWSDHRLPVSRRNIDSTMKRSFTVERIDSLAEGSGYGTFDRPEIRSGIGSQPVRSSRIPGKSKRNAGRSRAAEGSILESIKTVK